MAKSLSETQLDIIHHAAAPLAPGERAAFLDEVAAALAEYAEFGDGAVYRVCREVQRQHWDPPQFSSSVNGPKLSPRLR